MLWAGRTTRLERAGPRGAEGARSVGALRSEVAGERGPIHGGRQGLQAIVRDRAPLVSPSRAIAGEGPCARNTPAHQRNISDMESKVLNFVSKISNFVSNVQS